ncbi:glycosyltransferase family 4 protein [Pelomonas sp. SE-A7]|uniref:glycosyltransferase family 4 protein n=1 Tax=Pelomonas sp. SE-A7 TaxID=3054953 RepID=UPI00259D0B43|nr:glycosyltransferase family 4 protein [Pelomonas sp. SE-A7]MDM4765394.1 glycosyltransferase family 4 protein [Pelomonas sp. SE-A7]
MLKVVQISFHADPAERAAEDLLNAWPTVVELAESAAAAGASVQVLQASRRPDQLRRGGIDYRFLPMAKRRDRLALLQLLQDDPPDLLHLQGLGFPAQASWLATELPGRPLLLQDRADQPARRWWRHLQSRRALASARGLLFCSREQAVPWQRQGLLKPPTRIYELPGSSSRFGVSDRLQARGATGLVGDPALLWVAHLDANKDPLTVLDGLALASEQLPGLKLWCCFDRAPLLEQVQARIAGDSRLAGRVQLLGRLPHAEIERWMNAADFLVQGSQRESTGYSVIEALACGLPLLVTDIPAFRALAGPEPVGRLWRAGDPYALHAALLALAGRPPSALRQAARQRFESELSPQALGRRLVSIYEDLLLP